LRKRCTGQRRAEQDRKRDTCMKTHDLFSIASRMSMMAWPLQVGHRPDAQDPVGVTPTRTLAVRG